VVIVVTMVVSLHRDHGAGGDTQREREGSESESVNEEREHEIEVDRDWIERGEGVRGRNRSKKLKP
jgi:hypothetical protein